MKNWESKCIIMEAKENLVKQVVNKSFTINIIFATVFSFSKSTFNLGENVRLLFCQHCLCH